MVSNTYSNLNTIFDCWLWNYWCGNNSWTCRCEYKLESILIDEMCTYIKIQFIIHKEWEVFLSIEELFILVPALLGLKGNLDTTLASRLSTQANLGNMVNAKEVFHICLGNIALVQVQAIVAGFIVSFFSVAVGYSINGGFVIEHACLMVASSVFTATSSCLILDFVLVGFVLLSIKYKSNPDNMVSNHCREICINFLLHHLNCIRLGHTTCSIDWRHCFSFNACIHFIDTLQQLR